MGMSALHRDIDMGTRVIIPVNYHNYSDDIKGEVVGISSVHWEVIYIVLLDRTIESFNSQFEQLKQKNEKIKVIWFLFKVSPNKSKEQNWIDD
jgi:hypothetical protein